MTATEVWNYPQDETIFSPFCGSVYEDAPINYLIDYALVGGADANPSYAQLLGLDATGEKIFYYQYITDKCNTAFNSFPLHLERTSFPTVGPQALNISTRGMISSGDNTLIAGFIISGTETKKVALRTLGPSLAAAGVSDPLADPQLKLFDASGAVIASNDDWQSDPSMSELSADGLAPTNSAEAATIQTLAPGAYTVVATGKGDSSGIGLVEAYDLSPDASSRLANISTRSFVGTGDSVLISGFIVGDVSSATVIVRALGPSLGSTVSDPLSDPQITVYDNNGSAIASNDNWQDNVNSPDVQKNGLAPSDSAESALVLRLPAGAYTTIVDGADGQSGISLLEVYNLN
jgi:hypothetical protein